MTAQAQPTHRLHSLQYPWQYHPSRVQAETLKVSSATLAGIVLSAAVLFNLLLAFVNANGIGLSRAHVIAVEGTLLAAALTICMKFWSPLMRPWLGIMWFLTTLFIALSLTRQAVDPKYLRDVMLIPIFVMLGIGFQHGNIVRLICALQAVVVLVMLFEAAAPVSYGNTFNVTSYYVNTRDFQQEGFWNAGSNLFLSALRPGERFLLAWLNIHRLSSIFLEPVSLGNWCIIITIFIVSFWRTMSIWSKIFLVLTNAAILIGSDGRLATVTCLILACSPLLAKLPRYTYALYLPVITAGAFWISGCLGLTYTADDFGGRIAYSMDVLSRMELGSWLGIDHSLIKKGADSGVAYLVLTQSIFGTAVLWLALCYLQPPSSRRVVIMMHGICIYIALNLLISFSLFSIKTAAPLWFIYGYVRGRTAGALAASGYERRIRC